MAPTAGAVLSFLWQVGLFIGAVPVHGQLDGARVLCRPASYVFDGFTVAIDMVGGDDLDMLLPRQGSRVYDA